MAAAVSDHAVDPENRNTGKYGVTGSSGQYGDFAKHDHENGNSALYDRTDHIGISHRTEIFYRRNHGRFCQRVRQ